MWSCMRSLVRVDLCDVITAKMLLSRLFNCFPGLIGGDQVHASILSQGFVILCGSAGDLNLGNRHVWWAIRTHALGLHITSTHTYLITLSAVPVHLKVFNVNIDFQCHLKINMCICSMHFCNICHAARHMTSQILKVYLLSFKCLSKLDGFQVIYIKKGISHHHIYRSGSPTGFF